MEAKNLEPAVIVEYKELLVLNEKLMLLETVVNEFRNNVKSLKICYKLIKNEQEVVKRAKIPVSVSDLHSIQWRYEDFIEIVKRLIKSNDANSLNKALSDLNNMKQKTIDDIKQLKSKIDPLQGNKKVSSIIENTAQIFTKKLEEGAHKLGDTLSGAVNGKVEDIKKLFAGDGNCE